MKWKFIKTIFFTISIKVFFIGSEKGSEDEESCCKQICPCFFGDSNSEITSENVGGAPQTDNVKNLSQTDNVKNLSQTDNVKNLSQTDNVKNLSPKNVFLNWENKNIVGLDNVGATCYMNATLQCFSNTKELTKFFLTKYQKAPNRIMSNAYYDLIKELWKSNSNIKSYAPDSFKTVLSQQNSLFAGIQANDSKDLVNFLLERMHAEMNTIKPGKEDNNMTQQDPTNEELTLQLFFADFCQKYNSPISDLFHGVMETISTCAGCNTTKYNFQVYSFLEFPLQQVNFYYFNSGIRPLYTNNGKNPDVNLYECFEYNRKMDFMTGDNQMWCNTCNKLCDSYYLTKLYSAPNYLIINLNRGKGAVYECNVIFPEELNIAPYLSPKNVDTVFELYAVICHLGPSSMSGHFVAYVKKSSDNKWYLCNDSTVTECTTDKQYTSGMPYILFYKMKKKDS